MIEVNGLEWFYLQDGSWQKNFFYILQYLYIFDDMLVNNICFYYLSVLVEDIVCLVVVVGLVELVDNFFDGLEGWIGEGGWVFSGG